MWGVGLGQATCFSHILAVWLWEDGCEVVSPSCFLCLSGSVTIYVLASIKCTTIVDSKPRASCIHRAMLGSMFVTTPRLS